MESPTDVSFCRDSRSAADPPDADVTFLRPAWFIENAAWDVASARNNGVIESFLQPVDTPLPMVATEDVGRVAAALLQQNWTGRRVVELEGPCRVAPLDVAAVFTKILGHVVRVEAVPRDTWSRRFASQRMRHPLPRLQLLDGFNEGWIDFEGGQDLDVPLRSMHADPLPIPDQPSGMLYPHDGRQAVLRAITARIG